MKKLFLLIFALILTSSMAMASDYNFISPEKLKQGIEKRENLLLLDIQVEADFTQHHLEGALATYAYPVKSDADRDKLTPVVALIKADQAPVVIICPRGGGGAKRAYDFLVNNGVEVERLKILEGGQQKWPYAELLAKQ